MSKLTILWTSTDPDTVERMVFMYAGNAKKRGWWDEVTLVIWGGSSRYVMDHPEIHQKLKEIAATGVKVSACKACADEIGSAPVLEELGIEVIYWGVPLTEALQGDGKVLSV